MPPICIEAAVDKHLRNILDALPESPPRSCLDPLRKFIEELRRRGRTYRLCAAAHKKYLGSKQKLHHAVNDQLGLDGV
jgi:hypothetical protein